MAATYFLLHGIARFQLIQSAQIQYGICLQILDLTENCELLKFKKFHDGDM